MLKRTVLVVVVIILINLACGSLLLAGDKPMKIEDAIAQAAWFEDLTKEEKDALKTVSVIRRGKAGEKIIEQGKLTKRMFVVLNGRAEVLIGGKQVVVLSGEFMVGEIEFLDMSPATADVVLTQEADIIEINNGALCSLMDKMPRIGYILMAELARVEAERLRETNARWNKTGN